MITERPRVRAVRDTRYKYIRNFQPELPYAQKVAYGEEMPTMQEWRRLHAEGKLNAAQKIFFSHTKPKEELYDLETDPFAADDRLDWVAKRRVLRICFETNGAMQPAALRTMTPLAPPIVAGALGDGAVLSGALAMGLDAARELVFEVTL